MPRFFSFPACKIGGEQEGKKDWCRVKKEKPELNKLCLENNHLPHFFEDFFDLKA